jgi:hypothetical protein
MRIRIFNSHRRWIAKGLLSVSETNLVLGEIRPSFRGIEFDLHLVIMHIVCISHAYCQALVGAPEFGAA